MTPVAPTARRALAFVSPLLAAAAALLLLAAAACSSGHEDEEPCPELCERTAECPGATTSSDACISACESMTSVIESAGCSSDWASALECHSHASDACDATSYEEECSLQYDAYKACLQPYCASHPAATECATPGMP